MKSQLPFVNKSDVDTNFHVFIEIIENAIKERFRAVRISGEYDTGWFEIPILNELSLRQWVEQQNKDYKIKIKSIIQKTEYPLIPENEINLSERYGWSEYVLKDKGIEVKSLGAAYLLQQPAISCLSDLIWDNYTLAIEGQEATDEDINSFEAKVVNCASLKHWKILIEEINTQRKKNLQKGNLLWEERETQFPNLIFCGNTSKRFKNISVSNSVYNQLWKVLTSLNQFCNEFSNYSLQNKKKVTELDISDESSPVKQKPMLKRYREFDVNGEKVFFGFHIKNFGGAFRLHFYPVAEEKKIYIGYFGKHLPLS